MGACGGERGGAQETAAAAAGPGALAGSQLRLLTAASPPPAGSYGASRIPPGPGTELLAWPSEPTRRSVRGTARLGADQARGVGGERHQTGCLPGVPPRRGPGRPHGLHGGP